MIRRFATSLWVAGWAMIQVQTGHPAQFQFGPQTFSVPDGFIIELVAGPPLVDRPISASFDEQGDLYVTDSSGSNDPVQKQLVEKPHRVLKLESAGADGRFSRRTVFAEHLMFPEGCLWQDGSLYVSAPPTIWKLTDADQDGSAERLEEWHQGKTLTGCANDLHGPYLGLDGWIYWCKGAFARQTYQRPGRKSIDTTASHIFRSPPDHSDIEPVLTAGMDNPVGVVFMPNGERFMCGTFLLNPEAGKRDGIVHAVYGGVYGKQNSVTDEHQKTGELMPVMTHLGAAAPCSVIRYESPAFGQEYHDNLFVCCFNLHKVTRHVLEPQGATFKTKDSDFLVSDNTDFHPTDVVEDADGSLIVIDTGPWYKLCCPTSQLAKPDVLGAIYRIRRLGVREAEDPRGLKLAWEKLDAEALVKLLADARPVVRKRALHQLGKLGAAAVPPLGDALRGGALSELRRNAVWAMARISNGQAREAVRLGLFDQDDSVVEAAIHSVSLWRDTGAVTRLLDIVQSAKPPLQRAAAEALGRIGDSKAVPVLLAVSAEPHDRILQHSLTYALIEIGDAVRTAKGLSAQSLYERCATLIALDQMEGGGLKAEVVAPLLAASDPLMRQTAAWVAAHHGDWGGALAGCFRERLAAEGLTAQEKEDLRKQLATFASAPPLQNIMALRLDDPTAPPEIRLILLDAMAHASLEQPPADWIKAVAASLGDTNELIVLAAVATAKAFSNAKTHAPDFSEALMKLGLDSTRSTQVRLESLAALPHGLSLVNPDLLTFLCSNVDTTRPVADRSAATVALAKASLTDENLLRVTEAVKSAGPLELTKLVEVFDRSTNALVGLRLMEGLKASKGLASLRPDVLRKVAGKYPESVQKEAGVLLALLDADASKQSAHLEELLASLKNGDTRRGQAIFNSQKTACSTCHTIGYLGGHVGPDLTSIGQVRTERDLLESIVYPSASFVRSFEPYIVKTKSDEEYSGVLRKDSPDEIVLATGPSTEVRVARADIVDMRPSTVSVMPAGLEQQLSKQELADLVTFLKATKWGAN